MNYAKLWLGLCTVVCALATTEASWATPYVFQVEGDTVLKTDTYQTPTWDLVNLTYSYEDPVVLAIPNTNGGNPADFRIRNITATSFELTLAEPPSEDGPHVAMTISYLVVESGQWKLPDAQKIAAGFVDLTNVKYKGGGSFMTVGLPSGFTNPIVLAQLQGQANEQNNIPSQVSSPWITTTVRNVTGSSFELALEGSECTLSSVSIPERVGWVAIEGNVISQFIDSDNVSVAYETIDTGHVVTGWDNGGVTVGFNNAYAFTPLFVAKLQTRNEDDGGWVRYSSLGTGSVALRVDEDQCQDSERFHTGEQAGLFVFSQNFRVQDDDPDGDGWTSPNDNCPMVANPAQSDVNNNGVGDACDCGDGLVVTGEQCDDGAPQSGDGCSNSCTIEPGWSCGGSPSVCTPICGDGMIVGSEQCDDGATSGGDGCSNVCSIEAGWICSGEPSVCTTVCGDGIIVGAEQCDDGDTQGGDGCSNSCVVEPGWTCGGEPSVCFTTCGDGVIAGSEQCDDGGNTLGDGCSNICNIEPGWTCSGEPSVCTTVCGDGIIVAAEQCDDGNSLAGDGCSGSCSIESGWTCLGEPSVCTTTCGDGLIAGTEQCDDGAASSGDGCSASCAVEPGWSCVGEPSVCTPGCGDGIIAGSEACDDGNLAYSDGCSGICEVSIGWTCDGEPSECDTICGDGITVGDEECDDGNAQNGDGCSSSCEDEGSSSSTSSGTGGSSTSSGAGGAGAYASDLEDYDVSGRGCICNLHGSRSPHGWLLLTPLVLLLRRLRQGRRRATGASGS